MLCRSEVLLPGDGKELKLKGRMVLWWPPTVTSEIISEMEKVRDKLALS